MYMIKKLDLCGREMMTDLSLNHLTHLAKRGFVKETAGDTHIMCLMIFPG